MSILLKKRVLLTGLENLFDQIGLLGLQIYLQPCVTLTFDLLTPIADKFHDPAPWGTGTSWHPIVFVHSFSKYHVHKFDNRQTNGCTENSWLRTLLYGIVGFNVPLDTL